MSAIKHRNYLVEYADDDDPAETREFTVRVITADILDAELHGPSYGINDPRVHSIAVNVMWVWRAALREGKVPPKTGWPEFRKRCLDYRQADDVAVPPTPPAPSGESASPSGAGEPEDSTSTSGSKPSATTSDS